MYFRATLVFLFCSNGLRLSIFYFTHWLLRCTAVMIVNYRVWQAGWQLRLITGGGSAVEAIIYFDTSPVYAPTRVSYCKILLPPRGRTHIGVLRSKLLCDGVRVISVYGGGTGSRKRRWNRSVRHLHNIYAYKSDIGSRAGHPFSHYFLHVTNASLNGAVGSIFFFFFWKPTKRVWGDGCFAESLPNGTRKASHHVHRRINTCLHYTHAKAREHSHSLRGAFMLR